MNFEFLPHSTFRFWRVFCPCRLTALILALLCWSVVHDCLLSLPPMLVFAASVTLQDTSLIIPQALPALPSSQGFDASSISEATIDDQIVKHMLDNSSALFSANVPRLSDVISQGGIGTLRRWPHEDKIASPEAIARALQHVFTTAPQVRPGSFVSPSSFTTQEIRYQMPEASEVVLIWGLNGWKEVPKENTLPPDTVVKDKVMHTPMAHVGDTFVAKLQLPIGAMIDYGFLITKTRNSTQVSVWDANGYPSRGYQTIVVVNRPAAILATVNLEKAQEYARLPHSPLIMQEIDYQIPEAGEVFLIWGINGWQILPEATRPKGTIIKNAVMQTPMDQQGDRFIAKVQVPAGATIDYGFAITRSRSGEATNIWEANGSQDFHVIPDSGGVIFLKSALKITR